ncbi:hypothetical protein TPHA_0B03830 [Tetrapisispora phaffii CBS 4417]|uniref:Flavodoxin-like domain-containing protein n=1 Tax=Tetrapisispora phaffii (strain ATCC 24235 / CBS 4417 / NBRC 1672 / NRRL Y-8282 / UCD 70-5) TaxID=1071381 RepID=G8BPX4_TETPH|nr:hypothetical protein TPHA_0B03830 [Tetrapisispora phaffii CBS 4417]CCE62055.1 hypothetical protein TPHA_0B03830 [Tetrapisispora phaffii CBS 4417]
MVRIAIISYSLYGHTEKIALAIQRSIINAGGSADLYRVDETLPDEVLQKMKAPPKTTSIPIASTDVLLNYDAFLFGVPTRFGTCSAQWSTFWDRTGGIWAKGSLNGKAAAFFVSSASIGGGQESTVKSCLNYLVHHGMIFIPLGYNQCFSELANITETHGGSPWGAGTLAGADGSRFPSELELRIASIQGKTFYEIVKNIYDDSEVTNKGANIPKTEGNNTQANKKTLKQVNVDKKNKKKSNCTIS